MELGWWNRDERHGKYQVHLEVFGQKLRWRRQLARFEPWEDFSPTEEDWDRAIELVENRYQRRLVREDVVRLIRRRGTG